jgi:hypothetical protein
MKVAYLTIEDVSSGLFKTQILDIIEEISILDKNIKFEIFIINRPWKYFKHKLFLKEYRLNYSNKNIKLNYIPFLPPLRNSLKNYYYSFFVTKWLSLFFSYFIKKGKFDLIHSRSYWPTISVLNLKIPIIFDLRSLWILENISSGDLKINSKSYLYWQQIEIDCFRKAAYSTCVSESMVKYIKSKNSESKTSLIPISVNGKYFNYNHQKRYKNRFNLNWDKNIIFVYSGSLGQSGINIKAIKNLFKTIIEANLNYKILIITSEPYKSVELLLNDCTRDKSRFEIIHPKLSEITDWLSCADIGIHALPFQLDSNTRLGTKVVEYWYNGLPVIVNNNVGSAVQYISNHKIGYVFGENNSKEEFNQNVQNLLKYNRENISLFAKNEFCSKIIAQKYLKLYKDSIK